MAVNTPDKQSQLDQALKKEKKTYDALVKSIDSCEATIKDLAERKRKLDEAKKKFITVALIAIGVLVLIKLITG